MNTRKLGATVAVAACAALLLMSLAACSSNGTTSQADTGITVSASSETKVTPHKARVSFSVVTENKDAEKCRNENAKSVNAVLEALKGLGIADESIQTSYTDLSPRYGSRTTDKNSKASEDDVAYDEWVITGYEMTTELTVSDLAIDNVGATIEACVSAGANRTDGVQYYVSNYDEAYNETLGKALEVAKGKAEGIATSTDVRLGKVINVTEGYQDTSSRYTTMADANEEDVAEYASAKGTVANTMPGQVEISANVTVTYAIS